MPRAARSRWLDPLAFGVLAAIVGAIGSWIPSKWNDEAATLSASTRTLGQLWQMMHNIDAVHGFYYLLMHFWIIAFGTSDFALRAPSSIAVGFTAAGVVVLGKRLGTRRIALLSAAVFILLPRVTWMATEARSYAFTALVAVWLTIVLIRALERRRKRWWVLYAVLAAIGVLLNVYVALLVIAHGVTLVIAVSRQRADRRSLLPWAVSSVVAAGLASPIVSLVVHQGAQLPFAPLTPLNLANGLLIQQYFTGTTPTLDRYVVIPPEYLWSVAAVVFACIGWALMIATVAVRRIRWTANRQATLGLVTLTVPWIVIPFVLVVAYSLLDKTIYTPRYFSFTTPAVALLIGTSLAALTRRWLRLGALALIAVIALPIYVSQRGPTAKNDTDWKHAASVLQLNAKPGQDIYYGPILTGGSLSTGKMRYAYPEALMKLNDITLDQTGVQSNTLWDSQFPISQANGTLGTTSLLWAVIQHTGNESSRESVQAKYIESEGLRLTRMWPGKYTDVLLYTR
jgi:mannosyltransferase